MKKNTIALIAIFRNEADILEEFIQHHIWFGIDKFYLVNNASDDDFMTIIEKYKDKIELYNNNKVTNTDSLKSDGIQIPSYNRMLKKVKEEWALICDMDEFFYMRKGMSLDDMLTYLNNRKISQVLVPQKTFTSGGLKEQPKSLRESFFIRNLNLPPKHPGITKAIVRVQDVMEAGITACKLKDGKATTDGRLKKRDFWFANNPKFHNPMLETGLRQYRFESDKIFEESYITSNHYFSQSEDKFFNKKAKRGIATVPLKHGDETYEEYWQRRWKKMETRPSIEDRELIELLEAEQK